MTKTTTKGATMRGDIIQDSFGWFFRDNGDDTYDSLSANGTPKVSADAMSGKTVVLVRNGVATGAGDRLAARVAVGMAKRYVVTIDTSRYEINHGCKPAGQGYWWFSERRDGREQQYTGKFSDAAGVLPRGEWVLLP